MVYLPYKGASYIAPSSLVTYSGVKGASYVNGTQYKGGSYRVNT